MKYFDDLAANGMAKLLLPAAEIQLSRVRDMLRPICAGSDGAAITQYFQSVYPLSDFAKAIPNMLKFETEVAGDKGCSRLTLAMLLLQNIYKTLTTSNIIQINKPA